MWYQDTTHGTAVKGAYALGQFARALARSLLQIAGLPGVMGTEIRTQIVHMTWFERLKMWLHAYETKVLDSCHEAIGRGPTRLASQEAAEKRWIAAKKNAVSNPLQDRLNSLGQD